MTQVPKQVYTVLGLQAPKFQIFTAKFTSPCLDPFFQKVLISPKILPFWLHLNRPLISSMIMSDIAFELACGACCTCSRNDISRAACMLSYYSRHNKTIGYARK